MVKHYSRLPVQLKKKLLIIEIHFCLHALFGRNFNCVTSMEMEHMNAVVQCSVKDQGRRHHRTWRVNDPTFEKCTEKSILLVVKIVQNQVFDPTFKTVAPLLLRMTRLSNGKTIFDKRIGRHYIMYCRIAHWRYKYFFFICNVWTHFKHAGKVPK